MTTSTVLNRSDFKNACRRWRRQRKLSQLDLALAAGVSQRHLSWLETGRSQPSREMVIRLSEAMEVPLRERNFLLQSAGYSAVYTERQLDDPDMQVLRSESIASGDAHLQERFDRYIALAGPVEERDWTGEGLTPILPLELKIGDLELSLVSIFTTIGTPQDVTTDELRVEAFFPADSATEEFFRAAAR